MQRSKIAAQNGIYTGFRAKESNSALISSKETTILLEAKMRGSMLLVLIALCIGFCWGRSCYADIEKSDLENHDTTESEYSKEYATDDTAEYEKYATKEYKESYEGKDKGSPEYKAKFNDGKRDSKEYRDMYADEEYKEMRQPRYSKKYATDDTAEYEKYATQEYKDTYEGKDKESQEYKAKFSDGKRDSKEYRDMYANEEYKEMRQPRYSKKYATDDTAKYEKYATEEYKDTYEGKDKGSQEYKAKFSDGKRDSNEYQDMYANEEYKEKRQLGYSKKYATDDTAEYEKYITKEYKDTYEGKDKGSPEYKAKFSDGKRDSKEYQDMYANGEYKEKRQLGYSKKYATNDTTEYEKYAPEEYKDTYEGKDKGSPEYKAKVSNGKRDSKEYRAMYANEEYKEKRQLEAIEYTSKDCNESVSDEECENVLKKYKFFKQLYEDDSMKMMLKPDAYADLEREMEEVGLPVKTDKTDSKKYSEDDDKYTSKDCDSSVSNAQCEKILKKYTFFKQLYADDDMMKMLKPDAYTDLQREMEEAGIPVMNEKKLKQEVK